MTKVSTLQQSEIRSISSHFQRSINLNYDAGNEDYIAGYIPTPNGAAALAAIFQNTEPQATHRAHVLHAPYGSGKSLLSLVLSAVSDRHGADQQAIEVVKERLNRHYVEEASIVTQYQQQGRQLLPIILSGDEGSLTAALLRALNRSLAKLGLGDLRPRTQYKSALETVSRWEKSYPAVYRQLQSLLNDEAKDCNSLIAMLEDYQPKALDIFERLYPELTAGAQFDRYASASLTEAFHDTAVSLKEAGYDGIIIIWDEFGRFMEAKSSDAFGNDAAQLQTFAEFCNRSGEAQVHLILVTHRQLLTYASDLPTEYQQEWARIAERFQPLDVSSDPAVVYRLITEAIVTEDEAAWQIFQTQYQRHFDNLTARSLELGIFSLDDVSLRQTVVERAWPLHPLTVYALPRVSTKVAQNERTLFTYLAADEPNTFQEKLQNAPAGWWQVGVDELWDYFAEGIRLDIQPGGVHHVWSGVTYALSKVEPEDYLTQRVIKALGILTIVGDVNVQALSNGGRVVPTTDLLAWAINEPVELVATSLQTLTKRSAVAFRRADGFWTFTRGSDLDLEAEINGILQRQSPSRLQLRQLLEHNAPLPYHLPRGYNLEKKMVRYCRSLYRWPHELSSLGSDEALKQLSGKVRYEDGVVVYILATTSVEKREAEEAVKALPNGRAIYVIPDQPLLIRESLQELYALRVLENDSQFMAQDERLPKEVDFFIEDAQRRILRTLQPLLNPLQKGAKWYVPENGRWQPKIATNQASISRLLTQLNHIWFDKTPVLNNESINQRKPTTQQINAANKVIDALLVRSEDGLFPFDLDLQGYGPDRLILRTLLVQTGLLNPIDLNDEDGRWQLTPPQDENLLQVWDTIQTFLNSAIEDEQEVEELIDRLQRPPFGLRRGVLPVLLAAAAQPRLRVLTIRHQRKVVSPLTGETFTTLCQKPDEFTVEVGPWEKRHAALWDVLEDFSYSFLGDLEREQQPLSYLSVGLLRWLQSQPRYCRDTNNISKEARDFRQLIRKAQRDPASVLFYDMLDLLDENNDADPDDEVAHRENLKQYIGRLSSEIASSYQALLYQLDRFIEEEFASNAPKRYRTGQAALRYWLSRLDEQIDDGLKSLRFSDVLAQNFIDAVQVDGEDGRFWDNLSRAIIGITPYDWNDRSVDSFKEKLIEARDRLQNEALDLRDDEAAIELHVARPETGEVTYRFRPSELTVQGQNILQNFKSTMAIAGRPLSPDEKRQVALAFLNYILEGEDPDHERKNKSLRSK